MKNKIAVPNRVSTSRFAMTSKMSNKVARRVYLGGEFFHWGCIILSGGCAIRFLSMLVKWNGRDTVGILSNIGIALFLLAISGGLAWGTVYICLTSIWRGTSGFYKRYDKRVMQGYVNSGDGNWVELKKEIVFLIWYCMDSVASVASFLLITIANMGGIMFVLRADNTLASGVVSFVIGAFIMFMAIAFPIAAGHIEKHAIDLENYEKDVDKYWSIRQIEELAPSLSRQPEMSEIQRTPAPQALRSGNTITGQVTYEEDDDEVEIEIDGIEDLESMPNPRRGGRR